MRLTRVNHDAGISVRAFTIPELLVAMAIGVMLAGTAMAILVQTAVEQRNGLADTTVEQQAYMLESRITGVLRCMSANQGMTPNYSTKVFDGNGNLLGYQSILLFYPSNGDYETATLSYNPALGQVTYVSNTATASPEIWISNTTSYALGSLYFSTSFNPDGSQNNSLVNVAFQINDNGFSEQGPPNNPANVFRNFSVLMRNDN
jgi:type II secretory pathway pseudopilin PulG